jgi:hypothetical protein
MAFRISKLGEIYDRIEAEQSTPMNEADGYRWGLDYLKDITRQLEKLEQRALQKNDPVFYNSIKLSMQRVKEAQAELDAKLGSIRKI